MPGKFLKKLVELDKELEQPLKREGNCQYHTLRGIANVMSTIAAPLLPSLQMAVKSNNVHLTSLCNRLLLKHMITTAININNISLAVKALEDMKEKRRIKQVRHQQKTGEAGKKEKTLRESAAGTATSD